MILIYSILVGVAAYRLFRITAIDTITEPLRDWLYDDGGAVREFLGDLNGCPWCSGWWWSLGLAYAVAEWQDYGAIECALVALVGSVVCGVTHHAVERIA